MRYKPLVLRSSQIIHSGSIIAMQVTSAALPARECGVALVALGTTVSPLFLIVLAHILMRLYRDTIVKG